MKTFRESDKFSFALKLEIALSVPSDKQNCLNNISFKLQDITKDKCFVKVVFTVNEDSDSQIQDDVKGQLQGTWNYKND